MKRIVCCLTGLLLAFALQAAEPRRTVVFEAGRDGYACYRIPALVCLPDGALLAFAEARRDGTADSGDIDLVVRRSEDRGATWGPMRVVWDDGPNTCGNPAPVIDRSTGRLLLFACWNRGADREREIEAGRSPRSREVFLLHSDDGGRTWSEPRDLTPELKREGWTWYATGPCHAIQKRRNPHKGRLIVPANHKRVGVGGRIESYSHLIYSDDGGASWRLGAVSQHGGNESTVAELCNGDVLLNMRHYERADSLRLCALSRDGGESWSRCWEETALLEPRCQGSLLSYPDAKGRPSGTLLFSNPRSRRRENLSIGVSRDDGATWERFHTVWAGRAAYSDLAVLDDGSVGVLYENGDPGGKEELYRRITFETVPAAMLFDR